MAGHRVCVCVCTMLSFFSNSHIKQTQMLQQFIDECTLRSQSECYCTPFADLKLAVIAFYTKHGAQYDWSDFQLAQQFTKHGLNLDTTYMLRNGNADPMFYCCLEDRFNREVTAAAKAAEQEKAKANKPKKPRAKKVAPAVLDVAEAEEETPPTTPKRIVVVCRSK